MGIEHLWDKSSKMGHILTRQCQISDLKMVTQIYGKIYKIEIVEKSVFTNCEQSQLIKKGARFREPPSNIYKINSSFKCKCTKFKPMTREEVIQEDSQRPIYLYCT